MYRTANDGGFGIQTKE